MVFGAASTFGGQISERPPESGDHSVSVATTSTQVLSPNPKRIWASFVNDGNNVIYLQLGRAAVLNTGIRLNALGGSFIIDKNTPWDGLVYGIASTLATNLVVVEVEAEFR